MNHDFRFYVKTRFSLGLSAQDIHYELVAVHREATPNERTIFRWIADIKNGSFALEKKTSPGRPILTCTPTSIRKVRTLITQNERLSCADIASHLSSFYPKNMCF